MEMHEIGEEQPHNHKRGKLPAWDQDRIDEVIQKLNEYIDSEEVPELAEFAYKNDIHRQRIYDIPDFADALDKLQSKCIANLFKLGLYNKINCSMAQFGLQQRGWKKNYDLNHGGQKDNPMTVNVNIMPIGDKTDAES